MIQPRQRCAIRCAAAAVLLLILGIGGCERSPAPSPSSGGTTTRPATDIVTVASMSPAFTDLILSMGGGSRLVAVSNFEPPRTATEALPRVGDYRTVDWEKIAQVRPRVLLTQYRADKMPDGLVTRAREFDAEVVNLDIDTLADVDAAMVRIGQAIGMPAEAAAARDRFLGDLDAVKATVAGKPPAPAMIVIGPSGLAAVGSNNFLDELLTIAGGRNVLAGGPDYSTIDRERLIELNPPAIIQLLPAATPQVIEQADAFWRQMPDLSAVKAGRVHQITDADALLPATNSARIARKMADALHGDRSRPTR